MRTTSRRRICFVTGTRAEFGLMRTVLEAVRLHPMLQLQIVATGMHLDPKHGSGVHALRQQGWHVDALAPWPTNSGQSPTHNAINTGKAVARLAEVFERLRTDIVLVVGDRVEAFAAASAAHLSHHIVAHVHGGDRALGQVDDCLRHAISKLAHVHFPATRQSARRLARLGEDAWRIHQVGSPGNDGIKEAAAPWELVQGFAHQLKLMKRRYALLVLHPAGADAALEEERARLVAKAVERVGFDFVVVVYPNNDPGSAGIIRAWKSLGRNPRLIIRPDMPRPIFLAAMRDAAVLVGNSSSGIIEAASFSTPVVDIGPRQTGRERSSNVMHVNYDTSEISEALAAIWNDAEPHRPRCRTVYGGGGAGQRMADILSAIELSDGLRQKLIAY